MDRTSLIEARLTQHLEGIGAQSLLLSEEEWANVEAPNPVRKQVGFIPPMQDEGWLALLCPARIARQTAHLRDEDLELYLDAVEWIMDKEVELHLLSPVERQIAAENALAELAPGSLRVMTEVHMRSLDASTD